MNRNNSVIKRNVGFDVLKCICAFLVVCIHAPFPGLFGEYIKCFARVAIPLFFMITGFYYKNTIINNKQNNQIMKVLKLILLSNFVYFIVNFITNAYSGTIIDYCSDVFSIKSIIKLVIFNESPFCLHLWYLNALLYVLIIFKYIPLNNSKVRKILFAITPILLLIDLIFGKYSLLLWNKDINILVVRNFMFVGVPYFLVGYFLNNYITREKRYNLLFNISLIILFAITTFIERYMLITYNYNATRNHYISTTFLAITIFIYFYNLKHKFKFLNKIGDKHSTNIYLYHPLFIIILSKVFESINLVKIYDFLKPVLVFTLTLSFSNLYNYFVGKMKKSIN